MNTQTTIPVDAHEPKGSAEPVPTGLAAQPTTTKPTAFTGNLIERGVNRQVVTTDPATGRQVRKNEKLDIITGLLVDRVSGLGKMTNTGEPYIVLSGQYAPGKLFRVTASAQHYEPVRLMLKDNVNGDEARTLKTPITVTAVGERMKGFGMLAHEIYLNTPEGPKVIIGPAQSQDAGDNAEQAFL